MIKAVAVALQSRIMICYPNAKINLGLNIVERRPDGFHNIESVFLPTAFTDILELLPDPGAKPGDYLFFESGIKINGHADDNLVVKAYKQMAEDYDLPAVKIALHKQIPWGAGLGGGSADGAFMLMALNSLFKLNLSVGQLGVYAARLGSDCPFFLENRISFVTGRGEIIRKLDIDTGNFFLIIVTANVKINTAMAYSGIRPVRPVLSLPESLKEGRKAWKKLISNDFEKEVFGRYPRLGQIKEELYNMGAFYSSMSGSGSAVYGLFENEPDLKGRFANELKWSGWYGGIT